MTDFDDKTQQWLLKTQAIRREPALRGGVPVDYQARWQTAACVAAVAAVLFLLAFVPSNLRLPKPPPPKEAPFTHQEQQGVLLRPLSTPARLFSAAAPAPISPPLPSFPLQAMLPPPGRVAPPAPIWLDGPTRFGPFDDR